MEETLGKRIVQNRKRLGLTQDRLAELLGVTAQAVSKWENDQSCPDITMLPKLAEIFDISTDVLLGIAPRQAVREAEVLPEENDEEENEGIHIQKGNWEFKYDADRSNALSFAILILMCGALTLLSRLLHWNASFWDILWPSALLVFGVRGMIRRISVINTFMSLCGIYFLTANLNRWEFSIGLELLFPVLLLVFGICLLADALKKPKHSRFRLFHNGKPLPESGSGKFSSSFTIDGETFACSTSFGENERYIQLPRLSGGEASVSFGELTVDLSGCEELTENCRIEACCSFGELKLLVPRKWRVEDTSGTAFGSVEISGHPDPDPQGVIYIDCSANFGEIEIRYI